MDITAGILLYVLLPGWITLGFLDWLCHRRAQIALRCGPWESLLHLLLLAEAGTAILALLLLEVNTPVLAILGLCFIAHEVTAYVDIRYAHARREIAPAEQRVHDFMTAVPVAALCLIVATHWEAARALALDPGRILTEGLRWKSDPLPRVLVLGVMAAVAIIDGLPYLEELMRGLRRRPLIK